MQTKKLPKLVNLFKAFFSDDLGIDLGTMNTLIWSSDKQAIVVNEPSVVATDTITNRVRNVGAEAKRMIGRTPPNIKTTRPVRGGIVADGTDAQHMITRFLRMAHGRFKVMQPRVLIGVPFGITNVSANVVVDCAKKAGAREVRLIAEPFAAAVGAGLQVEEPTGSMIVDIGGGTTEVAIISLGAIENGSSISWGGDNMDDGIIAYMKDKHNLLIGERAAEEIKMTIGVACPSETPETMEVSGLEMGSRQNMLPRTVTVNSNEICEAVQKSVQEIIGCILATINATKPELGADLLKNGIMLSGGGSKLRRLDYCIEQATGLKVRVAKEPLLSVVRGTAELLEEPELIFSMPDDMIFGCSSKQN